MGSWWPRGAVFPPPPEPVNWDYPCPISRRISGRGVLPVRSARHNPWSIATLRRMIAQILLRRLKGCPCCGTHFYNTVVLGYTFGRCYSPKTGRAHIGTVPAKTRG